MSNWYKRDGTLITKHIVGDPRWLEEMQEVEKLLRDNKYKRVAETTLSDGKWISTVWIGLDYSYIFDNRKHKPLIFETMVFSTQRKRRKINGKYRMMVGDELDVRRYSTEEEALKGHKAMVKKWKRKILKI